MFSKTLIVFLAAMQLVLGCPYQEKIGNYFALKLNSLLNYS